MASSDTPHKNQGAAERYENIMGDAIYEEWLQSYNAEPNIEYGHFFANPVRITSTGPSTIPGVLNAHRSLRTQASSLINQAKGRADNIIKLFPSNSQHYSLFPLYNAIVVIIDRLDYRDKDCKDISTSFVSLRKVAQYQTVLIARTGAEEGLNRLDVIKKYMDIVRVSLAAAVRFIVSLEVREDLTSPKTENKPLLDTSLCPGAPKGFEKNYQVRNNPETWVDANMTAAEEHGYDNILDTWASIRRAQAGLIGEGFREFGPTPSGNRWR
ncbi:MAG: hypothetical protein M1834_008366 [Cirrosporium novae-zelandiae]|nr:MAG: hypothetical protein M1834_008366 [Cirrosporium novae-zelandiae]